jgi:drug/metabolite transporter (DMT)-like permease
MQSKTIGIIMVIIGILMLTYTGFNYVTTETIVDIGPLQVEAKKNNFVKLSPILGIILLVGGLFFISKGNK